MKTVQAAALAILFLLIPHQEPLADSSRGSAQAAKSSERPKGIAIAESDGFVWSQASSPDFERKRVATAAHLATDGYSWSVRSDRTALDSTR